MLSQMLRRYVCGYCGLGASIADSIPEDGLTCFSCMCPVQLVQPKTFAEFLASPTPVVHGLLGHIVPLTPEQIARRQVSL